MPQADVSLTVLPPPFMADALGAGRLDGYCVGEPWNSEAAARGTGRIVTTKAAIWRSSPEKVLGMRAEWAERHPETVRRLLAALHLASVWCEAPENRAELAELLARPAYLDLPAERLLPGLGGAVIAGAEAAPDFLIFARKAATFPWVSHALWFYSQMVRWRQAELSEAGLVAARSTYRPDLYRAALKPLGVSLPGASAKAEGALKAETPVASSNGRMLLGPDGFFDGRVFDPDDVAGYLRQLAGR
jgi:NitT/TauT family transport system ATP-binding protein